jgi:hypothetical protein
MKQTYLILASIFIAISAQAQQFAGTGKGKMVFGLAGSQQEYGSESVYSNINFYTNKISFHFKTSTFLPVNNSDATLVSEVFDAGHKGALEFSASIPPALKNLKIKESLNTLLKGNIAYGSVKRPVDIPVKVKRIGEDKYEFVSNGLLSLPALGVSPQSSVWKKTEGTAKLVVEVDLQKEI